MNVLQNLQAAKSASRLVSEIISGFRHRWDWIQIEVSSYCNGECIYCPHSVYKQNWQNRMIPIQGIYNLLPAFDRSNLIHLQGWGEPFTNPDFLQILRLIKQQGNPVATTTNGTFLTDDLLEALVEEGLDIITFSLAGLDKKNDVIRHGTSLQKVLRSIEIIQSIKSRVGVEKPEIHIAYLLLRSGADDVRKFPKFFANLGVKQVVVNSLSFVVRPELEKALFLNSNGKGYSGQEHLFSEVERTAGEKGVEIKFQIAAANNSARSCPENPAHSTFISANGNVSPCVFHQIPIEGENYYYFKRHKLRYSPRKFGNILDKSLLEIWKQQEYPFFRVQLTNDNLDVCKVECYKQFIEKGIMVPGLFYNNQV